MTTVSQCARKAGNPFASALGLSGLVLILLFAAGLRVFGVSLIPAAFTVGAAALVWIALRHPVGSLGVVLAWMPIHPLAFLVATFFGPSYLGRFEGCDRATLLLLALILWRKNGVKLVAPDWFLLACFGLSFLRLVFGGTLLALLSDFNLVIAYAAGRVAWLTRGQEGRWARRAVWIVAVLSVLGGRGVCPRRRSEDGSLFVRCRRGDRRSCAECRLSRRWVYRPPGIRHHVRAASVCAAMHGCPGSLVGLLPESRACGHDHCGPHLSVTRSAWLGTAAAIVLLAVIMHQKRRFSLYAVLALGLFIAAVPILDLGDYLLSTRTGQDLSAQGHRESIVKGLEYVPAILSVLVLETQVCSPPRVTLRVFLSKTPT